MDDKKNKQNFIGKVVSVKMEKTVVVEATRLVAHPIYKKRIKKHKKFLCHVSKIVPKIGDIVRITSTRPISKNKRWRVSEVLQESKSMG